VINHPPPQAIIPKPKNPNSKEHPAETTPVGWTFLKGATLQDGIALELIRGWEDWQLAVVSESVWKAKSVLTSWPMSNSVQKPRRVITEEINNLEKDRRKGRRNRKARKKTTRR
jgi:hypothetical protein